MAFDGLVTRAIVNELHDKLLLGKIDKIYHPEKNELVFLIHTNKQKYKLYASVDTNHPGAYITDEDYQNPLQPSSFCMLLRKHLLSGRITSISQKQWERIIEIDFETRDEMGFNVNKRLIIEVMGKHSNIVLIDVTTGKIIDAIKRISIDVNRARQILPGMIYEYPPSQHKIAPTDIDESFFSEVKSPKDILNSIQGISPLIAEELFESPNPYNQLNSYLDAIENRKFCTKTYLKEDDTPMDFHVIAVKSYEELKQIDFDTVSQTIEYYYSHRESSNRVRQKSTDLKKHLNTTLKKLYLKKQKISEELLKAENSEKYRLYGELLTANIHAIKPGSSNVDVINYYNGETVSIPLDKRYHPSKNAQMYFKKYSKAKTAVVEKKLQLENTDDDINYLESVLSFVDMADTTETIENIREELIESGFIRRRKLSKQPKKKPSINPYIYKSSDGFAIYAGRNNKENDILTTKKASKTDLWFHTKDIPGSHTILFTQGKKPSDVAIFEAAAIAAYHSKGRQSENVPVDYTEIKYVKKPSGAKPGMVIFTNNKTVYVTPKLPSEH